MGEHIEYSLEEKYVFTPKLKKTLYIIMGVGLVLLIVGTIFLATGVFDSHHDAGHGAHGTEAGHGAHGAEGGHGTEAGHDAHGDAHTEHGGGGHDYNWMTRIWANLWLNGIFFTEIAVMGVLFLAIQYLAKAGWSSGILRVPAAMGSFLPITGAVLLITYFLGGHDLFHWTHAGLYKVGGPEFDHIIYKKAPFFFFPLEAGSFPILWLIRLVLYIGLWYWLYLLIKKYHIAEDQNRDLLNTKYYDKATVYSAVFIVVFAVTSSTSAWDWVMSIDTHWFSTMFGWYMFASGWVSALATITLVVVLLKEQGYLKAINDNHLHDLGKFIFAFSVFWTYIWFCQFLLYYYANIAEETIYFIERLKGYNGVYSPMLVLNLIICFVFPFLFLMTRDAKRNKLFLKVASIAILIGHYLDFFVMIMPGTTKEHGGFFLVEIGTLMIFLGAFIYVFTNTLSKHNLIPKKHPMLDEALHHNI